MVWLAGLVALAAAHYARAQEPVVDPPGRVARLSLMDGEVSMAPAGTEEWADAVLNRPVTSGDRLWVGTDGRAELQIGTASVHLDRSTGFEFIELDDDVMQMSLTEGVANIRVRTLGDREKVQIETPNATVSILHPGEYTVQIDPDSDRTIVRTRNGEAEVSGASKSFRVRANEEGTFTGLDGLTANIGSLSNRTAFENWANDRDRRGDESQAARYVSREVVGYEDLDGQGDWIDEPEYGYVWRPTYVAADWAPYRFGRWAWVAPWGWTWIDNAPWGYAPFHYGRWAFVRQRWCWVPGPRHLRPYYAPAVVGWVGSPSVSISVGFGSGVGWFPLGPREVFVPWYRHTPRYVRHVNVSNTIIVNNITNVYNRRGYVPRYSNSAISRAVTVAQRDAFVSGRQVGNHRVQVTDRDLRQWRTNVRPNSIAPDRQSIVAGQPRRQAPPPAAFARENPKNVGGDFRASRMAADQIKRAQARQPDMTADRRVALREPSRSVQSSQDRQDVERVQSMRGRDQNDRRQQQNDRQSDRPQSDVRSRAPVQSLQGSSDPRDSFQRDNSRNRPAERSFQRREEPVKRDQADSRDQPPAREWSQPQTRQAPMERRDAPVERRDAPVERRAAPVERDQPRFEPRRSEPQQQRAEPQREMRSSPPPRAPEASQPRSNNNRGNSNSNQGGNGPRVSRDRPNSQPD
ncbi:MAG TPA: DUF6600 domain-containing protein [Steroidobacteraceae bacterium]|nr:DUF6600 domain-containing protein [Steroidobacteraceae bacterium]